MVERDWSQLQLYKGAQKKLKSASVVIRHEIASAPQSNCAVSPIMFRSYALVPVYLLIMNADIEIEMDLEKVS